MWDVRTRSQAFPAIDFLFIALFPAGKEASPLLLWWYSLRMSFKFDWKPKTLMVCPVLPITLGEAYEVFLSWTPALRESSAFDIKCVLRPILCGFGQTAVTIASWDMTHVRIGWPLKYHPRRKNMESTEITTWVNMAPVLCGHYPLHFLQSCSLHKSMPLAPLGTSNWQRASQSSYFGNG